MDFNRYYKLFSRRAYLIVRIFDTFQAILDAKHESALLPIELAHGTASLSTNPSAHILKIFSAKDY